MSVADQHDAGWLSGAACNVPVQPGELPDGELSLLAGDVRGYAAYYHPQQRAVSSVRQRAPDDQRVRALWRVLRRDGSLAARGGSGGDPPQRRRKPRTVVQG
jgi:hypothetical protein